MHIPENITLDYIEKLDHGLIKNNNNEVIQFPDLTYDKNFKVFFKSNDLMLKRFLNTVIHLNEDINKMKVIFLDKELLETKINTRSNTFDYFININGNTFIDIEMYYNPSEITKQKSYLYKNREISTSLVSGEDYQSFKNKKYIQLNLNANNNKIGEDIIYEYSVITKSIYIDNVVTYLRYLEYYKNIYYNKFIDKEESDYWLALLTSKTFKEFYEILNAFLEKDFSNQIMKDVIELSMKRLFTKQEMINLQKQVEMDREDYYKQKGMAEGLKQGISQSKIEIAKKMLAKNIPLEDILEITNLTQEELNQIKN